MTGKNKQLKTASNHLKPPSSSSVLRMIKMLAEEKEQLSFSNDRANIWARVLSGYDPEHVTAALVQLLLSEDPFPSLGKVTRIAAAAARESQVVRADGARDTPARPEILKARRNLALP